MGFKVGVALEGGAAKGLAHFGVLKCLEKALIPIDIICESSIGSIVAALYANSNGIDECIEHVDQYLISDTFDKSRLEFMALVHQCLFPV